MPEYLIPLLGAIAALVLVGWYCRRWGRADGYAEGYDLGRQKGLLERDDVRGASGKAIGGGGEPVEPV